MSKKSDDSAKTDTSGAPNDAYRAFEAAHLEYFQDIQTIGINYQERQRAAQANYERAMIRATDEASARAALDEFRQKHEEVPEEESPAKACSAAWDKYKAAVQKSLAGAAAEHLDYATLAAVGQSLATVACHAAALAAAHGEPSVR